MAPNVGVREKYKYKYLPNACKVIQFYLRGESISHIFPELFLASTSSKSYNLSQTWKNPWQKFDLDVRVAG